MQLTNDGLTLWYATDDAPAPDGGEESRSGVSMTVAAQPASPGNAVAIRYRVDGGPERDVRAVLSRTDFARNTQYFRATFPDFWSGERVDYVPILSCAGRRVPDPTTGVRLPTSFRLTDLPPSG